MNETVLGIIALVIIGALVIGIIISIIRNRNKK
jgi:flagellar biosynthesis protein FliQ